MGGAHGHGHVAVAAASAAGPAGAGTAAGRYRRRLGIALAIAACVLVIEVAGAVVSGSLGLLADAGHVLADTAGLALSLGAATLATRPPTHALTFGLARAEILAAMLNALLIVGVAAFVIFSAVSRLRHGHEVDGGLMLWFAGAGLLGNLVSMSLLAPGRHESMNVRAAFLETAADALASTGVLLAALLVARFGWQLADPLVSLLVGLWILPRSYHLLRDSLEVLLEASPRNVDLRAVRDHILGVEHVIDVHDLHAMTVTSGLPVLSAHVVVEESCFSDGHAPRLLAALQDCLGEHFDVAHSTFQLEPEWHAASEPHRHH